MCDTFVSVLPDKVIFAKNSDRDVNEAQVLSYVPRQEHPRGSLLRCTWKSIPQVETTHAVILSRPFWMWGAEMGVNEYGVAIGNEAVFTDQPLRRDGLTGMDLLRLALERATNAADAVSVICGLLEQHGQGGRCGYSSPGFMYHNSFLIADHQSVFVVETADQKIAVEHVTQRARAISNGLTIASLCDHADPIRGGVAQCKRRRSRVESLAATVSSPRDAMNILRDHGEGNHWPVYHWSNGAMGAPCMHAGGLLAASQTVGSWVSSLTPNGSRHWATGTASPCLSLFQPVSFGDIQPEAEVRWWRFEKIHRAVIKSPQALSADFLGERDQLESSLCESQTPDATEKIEQWLSRWERYLSQTLIEDQRPFLVRSFWRSAEAEHREGPRMPQRAGVESGYLHLER